MAKRKKLTAAERREQLIEVGRIVFAERGFEATTVEEIAERAEVSKPIVYQHFRGKEGLYDVVVDREVNLIVKLITKAISSGSSRERAEKAAATFLSYVRDHPDGFAVLSHDAPAGKGGMSSVISEVASRVSEVFVVSFKAAGYDPKTAPIYAHALVGMVSLVGQWWVETRDFSCDEVARHIAALGWMGLRHLPKAPKDLPEDSK